MYSSSKKILKNQNGLDAAIYVGEAARKLSESICEAIEDCDDYDTLTVFLFCLALFYIEIDRRAFMVLPAKERESFSASMEHQLIEKVHKNWGVAKGDQPMVDNILYEQIRKLSPYTKKLVPEKDEGTGGTLYWEFGKLLDNEFSVHAFTLTIILRIVPVANWLNEQIDTLIPATSSAA